MKLLVLLPLGGSLATLASQGQLTRFINNYLSAYDAAFDKVYVASFANETAQEKTFTVLPNRYRIPRFFYALIFPFLYRKVVSDCKIVRVMQVSSLPTALICKLLFNAKVYVTYGYDYQKFAKVEGRFIQWFLFSLLKSLLLFRAEKVFFPVKSMYQQYKNNPKAIWLPNGVNLQTISNRLLSQEKTFNILFIGRLEKPKNIDEIFTAAKNANVTKKIIITIVGEGSLRQNLENQANKLRLNCLFTGSVPNNLIPNYLKKTDLFVLPSMLEGVSKALLEAMAAGIPVAAKSIFENRDIVENKINGFLYENTNQLTTIIENLAKNPLIAKKVGRAARMTVEKDYNLKKIIQQEISEMAK